MEALQFQELIKQARTHKRDTDLLNTSGHPNEIENISCYILQLLVNVIRAPNQFTVIISLWKCTSIFS